MQADIGHLSKHPGAARLMSTALQCSLEELVDLLSDAKCVAAVSIYKSISGNLS
jgi:hypothetical protein